MRIYAEGVINLKIQLSILCTLNLKKMNKVQNELQTEFDLYWAAMCNECPIITKQPNAKELAGASFMCGASKRQDIIERELGL